jgi:hypothetical protein
VDFIVLGFVGGGITQDCQRCEFLEGLKGLGAFQFLGLIENHDRVVALDDIDWFSRLEIIQFLSAAT